MRRALDSRDIRLNEMSCGFFGGRGLRRYGDGRASSQKPVRGGCAGAFCAAGNQDTFALEFTIVICLCARCSHRFLLDWLTVPLVRQ